MRFLVLGGLGYLGSRLTHYLQSIGHEVVVGTRSRNNEPPSWLPDAEVVTIDWSNAETLKKACSDVDVVVHSAGMDSSESFANPALAKQFKSEGCRQLLAAANDAAVKRFIYLSTIHVYSEAPNGDISEETATTNNHPYALAHLAGENAALASASGVSTAVTVLRISNVYGKPMHPKCKGWNLVLNDVCKQAVSHAHVRLSSDGSPLRDFIPVNSVCKSILGVATAPREKIVSQVFNLGAGTTRSISEMVEIIKNRFYLKNGLKITSEDNHSVHGSSKPMYFKYNVEKLKYVVMTAPDDDEVEIDDLLRTSARLP